MMDAPAAVRDHEWQYNPRLYSPDAELCRERASARSAMTRARLRHFPDVPYGEGDDELVDVFPGQPGKGAHLFFHGGYWRGRDKSDYSYIAEPLNRSGITVLVANYSLCPKVRVGRIVEQTARCLGVLAALAAKFEFDASRVTASGHSAGAHLLATALFSPEFAPDVSQPLAGLVLISGIYDLAPVLNVSVNEVLGLRSSDVRTLSPMHMSPPPGLPIDIIVGGAESPGWIAQSARFAEACQLAGNPTCFHVAPDESHFSIMERYADPRSALSLRLAEAIAA